MYICSMECVLQIVQKSIDEMPQHRCLLQVNPKLSKEEAYLVRREWENFVDRDGYLIPRAILEWFNRGTRLIYSDVVSSDNVMVNILPIKEKLYFKIV